MAARRAAADLGGLRRRADGDAGSGIVAGPRCRPRGQAVAGYLAPGRGRLHRALHRAEPGAVVGRQLCRRVPAERLQLSARDIRQRLSVRPDLSRCAHPDLRGILHAAGAGVHGARVGGAAGAGPFAAGGDLANDERRFTRATARGDRLVGTARHVARSRALVADEDVRDRRAARSHCRRCAVPGLRVPPVCLLGRRGGRMGDVGGRLAGVSAGGDAGFRGQVAGRWRTDDRGTRLAVHADVREVACDDRRGAGRRQLLQGSAQPPAAACAHLFALCLLARVSA